MTTFEKIKLELTKGHLKSFEIYPSLISFISKGSKLTVKDIEKLESIFGDRVKKALELIGGNRIKKYTFHPSGVVRWIVSGQKSDYLLIEHSFCSCNDFLFTALMKKHIPSCYHLLAREIAERTGKYECLNESDDNYPSYMEKWL